ncbi:MAG: hypothetical protein IRY88_11690 [Rubrobacteraceae bacterium]|uniref:hypothetical protein n=1 Tax=Rubrobacter naiadicus TaxID=1392641 RepID=UPI0023604A8D|nr:hypothetical protein [Rubrobacter naiadicus]MBX6764324.1 hypothetical protein [Rubrobacteraceae bacterium]
MTYRLLCAADVPAGCAARAAAMVQHAEVHHGLGCEVLHGQLDLIKRGGANPSGIKVRCVAGGLCIMDAPGSALAAGPQAMDVACSQAARRGIGIVYLRNASGSLLLNELAYRGAAAGGLVCILSWMSSPSEKSLGRSFTLVTGPGIDGYVGLELISKTAPILLSAVAGVLRSCASTSTHLAKIFSLLRAAKKPLNQKEVQELVNGALAQNGTDSGMEATGAAFVCARVLPGLGSWFEPLAQRTTEQIEDARFHTKATMEHAWSAVCRSGVEVDGEMWSELYAMSRQILVEDREACSSNEFVQEGGEQGEAWVEDNK